MPTKNNFSPHTIELAQELARECGWDGRKILAVAIEALIEANYHPEAEHLKEMIIT